MKNILTISAYTFIILITILWSGRNRELSIYNRYLISFQGIEIASSNFSADKEFYASFMQLPLIKSSETMAEFQFPNKKNITLVDSVNQKNQNIIRIRVRNGLKKLRKEFHEKMKLQTNKAFNVKISEITKEERTITFYLTTPSNDIIKFYQTTIF